LVVPIALGVRPLDVQSEQTQRAALLLQLRYDPNFTDGRYEADCGDRMIRVLGDDVEGDVARLPAH
jgi:hypothetical protein